jgi:hypothetical protein
MSPDAPRNVRIRAATVVHDGETYDFTEGPIPEDTPDAVVKALEEQGALGKPIDPREPLGVGTLGHDAFEGDRAPRPAPTSVATGFPEGDADPDSASQLGASEGGGGSSGPTSELPADAPNAETADVAELAAYIDAQNLNAAQTVALAGGTPEGARKVIEAERTASGGDGRTTVVQPLTKTAESGAGA